VAQVSLQNVTLEYPIYDSIGRSLRGRVFGQLRIGGAFDTDVRGNPTVVALKDVSLEFSSGDRIAVLGHNGAGKTTFLRLLAGVYEPQRGTIKINGRVSTIINIQLGMDRSASGYENILVCGLLNGLSRNEIDRKSQEIAEFSELGSFLEMPVRTYSQGMAMRLAFAICTSIEPDILLLDEWIGAGDADFLRKAQLRLKKLVGVSNLLVLATHRIQLIKELCNKALLLEHGEVKGFGDVNEILRLYTARK